tara:strand:- start:2420 stop:4270 length:1851 start_codon:yes stop_codon:yes gene_type:complete
MVKQKIFNCVVIILFITRGLHSQTLLEQKPKKSLWSLITIDKGREHKEGYWFDKLFRSREFSAPITYMPVEIRYGLGFNGKFSGSSSSPSAGDLDNWIWYDKEVASLDQEAKNIFGAALDIDFAMVNIPYLIMNTSWMNFLTGINYRSSSIFLPKNIPNDWKEGTSISENNIQFKPDIKEYLITNNLQWQPFNPWYINFRYSYGLASSKFYFDKDIETINTTPSGSGTSMALGLGFRYIIDPGKSNRFSIGFDIRHSYTKINKIIDPDNITPVNRFDIANYGIYFTLSTFYGGDKTIGDEAKNVYYRKDYLTSKNKFIEFIKQYPNHSNRYRAMKYISECNRKIPYQIMDQGLAFDDQGDSEKALDKYLKARKRVVENDTLIIEALNFRIDEIAKKWMNSAEMLLDKGLYQNALSLVKKVAKFSDIGTMHLDRFRSYVILAQGEKLQSILILGKAMEKYSKALELNSKLGSKVFALQYQAGIQLIELADKVDEPDEIILAIESLKEARGLSSEIGYRNEKLLKDLGNKLKRLSDYKSDIIIDHKMSQARYLQAVARSPRLTIGMTLPLIEELLGSPHEIVISDETMAKQQLWIYNLNDRQLHLSFEDFILFKIEEI